MNISRRSFLKKSSFAAGALTVLGTGTGLAEEIYSTSTKFRRVYQWGIYLMASPSKPDLTYKDKGNSKVPVRADGTTVGWLELDVEVTAAPDPAKKVTAAEVTNGIPNKK